jgi:hypothetical protein
LENPLLFTVWIAFGSCLALDIMGFRNSGLSSKVQADYQITINVVDSKGNKRKKSVNINGSTST